MRSIIAAGAALFLALHGVAAQACAQGSAKEMNGNWYCSPVKAITYTNFPGTGSYAKISHMDAETGQCSSQRYQYSGSLAPLNEELSLHVRGPVWLKQVAVYTPDGRNTKRNANAGFQQRRHWHHHLHHRATDNQEKHDGHIEHRAVGDLVSATIDGKVDYWTNEYAGAGVATSASAGPATDNSKQSVLASIAATDSPSSSTSSLVSSVSLAAPSVLSAIPSVPSAVSSVPSAASSTNFDPTPVAFAASSYSATSTGSWTRQAYYNAGQGTSTGLTFLNHFGTADGGPAFGASLSYASPDVKSGAASPQLLSNSMIEDDIEVIILSDKSCNDGDCDYTRPGGVAYHGFGGDHKMFLLEFSMPMTGKSGFNADMPAIWLMNAQIPLTSQYGTNADCSCWTSGCGEFDLFEILDTGNFRCKSTLHMAPAGGSSDYFDRPTKSTIKAAVVFTGSNESASIHIIDDGQTFDGTLAESVVDGFTSQATVKGASSLFKLSV